MDLGVIDERSDRGALQGDVDLVLGAHRGDSFLGVTLALDAIRRRGDSFGTTSCCGLAPVGWRRHRRGRRIAALATGPEGLGVAVPALNRYSDAGGALC
jgi:hypothetical protein